MLRWFVTHPKWLANEEKQKKKFSTEENHTVDVKWQCFVLSLSLANSSMCACVSFNGGLYLFVCFSARKIDMLSHVCLLFGAETSNAICIVVVVSCVVDTNEKKWKKKSLFSFSSFAIFFLCIMCAFYLVDFRIWFFFLHPLAWTVMGLSFFGMCKGELIFDKSLNIDFLANYFCNRKHATIC